MSTDYYIEFDNQELWIGNSKEQWVFSLNVIPEQGLYDVQDWMSLIFEEDHQGITDQKGNQISNNQMMRIIVDRFSWGFDNKDWSKDPWYDSKQDFLEKNSAVEGPCGLLRHKETTNIKHGLGTYDYIQQEEK